MENEKDEEMIRVVVKEVGMPPEERMIPNTLESLQERVGGLIERTSLPTDSSVDVWCNEEGLILGLMPNIITPEFNEFLAGDIVIAGCDEETGETISLNDRQVKNAMDYCERNNCTKLTYKGALIYSKEVGKRLKAEKTIKTYKEAEL